MREMTPAVSIIVPAHNYAAFIPAMLLSLQAQTLADWECIVVDDGSTDDTRAVVDEFSAHDPRIRYFHQNSQGPSAARNTGFAHSRGRYLQLLDADDLLEPDKLQQHMAYLDAHPEVDLIYGQVRYFRNEAPEERTLSLEGGEYPWTIEISASGPALLRALVVSNITATNAPLFRKELAQAAHGFDAERRYDEDWDFWIRCALAGGRFHFQHCEGTRALGRSHGINHGGNRVRMLAAEISLRQELQVQLADQELQALNARLENEARILLRFEEALNEPRVLRRWNRLFRASIGSRSMRWFVYSLALPVGRNPRIKLWASRTRGMLQQIFHKRF